MTNVVIAKFICETVTKDTYGERAVLRAVDKTGNPEDISFAEATPSGTVDIYISNKDVHGYYKPGKKYFVSFKEVE